VTSSGTAKVTLPTDEQILITREFDAPKHLVYRAWTTPELVKRWWSGNRGETTIAEIDLRVGGTWRCVTFSEADRRTTLKVLVQHASKEARDAHIDSGMEIGMQEAMDKLEQVAISLR
jgi:uncharacterized protein YndB with AHSA1/START domain